MWGHIYLKALNSAFKEHKEGGVWIDGLPFLENGLGFLQAPPSVGAVQSKEWLHYRVVPQEGQSGEGAADRLTTQTSSVDL